MNRTQNIRVRFSVFCALTLAGVIGWGADAPDRYEKSKIDLPSANRCYHALEKAAGRSTYPDGYVAAQGKNGRKGNGALLFSDRDARFFPGLTPVGTDDFIEFYGEKSEDFSLEERSGESALSDPSRGYLALKLLRQMRDYFTKVVRVPSKDTPMTDADRHALAQALGQAEVQKPEEPTLKDLQRYREISLRRDAIEAKGGVFTPTPEEARILKIAGTPHAEIPPIETEPAPAKTPVMEIAVPDLIEALKVCEKVQGDDRVSGLAEKLRKELESPPAPPATNSPPRVDSPRTGP